MKALALDTTTRAGSVALVIDDGVIDERNGDAARTHAERLPAEIVALADANHLALSDVDLFAVAAGPGSFTGLRIGIATVQGLAFVTRRPVVGISALEALAHHASRDLRAGTVMAAWMDAHRREVFAALYRVSAADLFEDDRLAVLQSPTVGDPAAILTRWRRDLTDQTAVFAGDGAVLYAKVIAQQSETARVVAPPPLAGAIGRLAIVRARRGGAVDPADIQPLYVRRPDAELARERKPV